MAYNARLLRRYADALAEEQQQQQQEEQQQQDGQGIGGAQDGGDAAAESGERERRPVLLCIPPPDSASGDSNGGGGGASSLLSELWLAPPVYCGVGMALQDRDVAALQWTPAPDQPLPAAMRSGQGGGMGGATATGE